MKHDLLTQIAQNPSLTEEQRDAQLRMIANHKALVRMSETHIQEQQLTAEGIFAYGKTPAPEAVDVSLEDEDSEEATTPEPSQEPESSCENSEDTPEDSGETPEASESGKKALPLGMVIPP